MFTNLTSYKLTSLGHSHKYMYFKSNYSTTSNNMKLVQWPLMGGPCRP